MTSGARGFFLYICTYSIYVIYAVYMYKALYTCAIADSLPARRRNRALYRFCIRVLYRFCIDPV
jgi:hypothetical protein